LWRRPLAGQFSHGPLLERTCSWLPEGCRPTARIGPVLTFKHRDPRQPRPNFCAGLGEVQTAYLLTDGMFSPRTGGIRAPGSPPIISPSCWPRQGMMLLDDAHGCGRVGGHRPGERRSTAGIFDPPGSFRPLPSAKAFGAYGGAILSGPFRAPKAIYCAQPAFFRRQYTAPPLPLAKRPQFRRRRRAACRSWGCARRLNNATRNNFKETACRKEGFRCGGVVPAPLLPVIPGRMSGKPRLAQSADLLGGRAFNPPLHQVSGADLLRVTSVS